MTFNVDFKDGRHLGQQNSECIFVDRDQFCELMLSYRKLVRSDDRATGTRGLLDVESGERFVIQQDRLFAGCH